MTYIQVHLNWPIAVICDSDSYAFSSFVNSNSAMIIMFVENDSTWDALGSVFRRVKRGKSRLGRNGKERAIESSFDVPVFRADGVVDGYKENPKSICK